LDISREEKNPLLLPGFEPWIIQLIAQSLFKLHYSSSHMYKWEDNIDMNLKEIGWKIVD
jgi:hypothetical protein